MVKKIIAGMSAAAIAATMMTMVGFAQQGEAETIKVVNQTYGAEAEYTSGKHGWFIDLGTGVLDNSYNDVTVYMPSMISDGSSGPHVSETDFKILASTKENAAEDDSTMVECGVLTVTVWEDYTRISVEEILKLAADAGLEATDVKTLMIAPYIKNIDSYAPDVQEIIYGNIVSNCQLDVVIAPKGDFIPLEPITDDLTKWESRVFKLENFDELKNDTKARIISHNRGKNHSAFKITDKAPVFSENGEADYSGCLTLISAMAGTSANDYTWISPNKIEKVHTPGADQDELDLSTIYFTMDSPLSRVYIYHRDESVEVKADLSITEGKTGEAVTEEISYVITDKSGNVAAKGTTNDGKTLKLVPGDHTVTLSGENYVPRCVDFTVNKDGSCEFDGELSLYKTGDLSGDGKLSAADAMIAIQIANGKKKVEDYMKQVADVTGDGAANAKDVMKLIQAVKGKVKLW